MSILLHQQMSVNRASTEHQQSVNRASTERQQSVNRASSPRQQSFNRASSPRQQSVNDFVCCTLYNTRAVLRHLCKIEVLAAFIGNIVYIDTVAPQNERQLSVNTALTEHQQSVNRTSTQCQQSVNRVSTILGVASCTIQGQY